MFGHLATSALFTAKHFLSLARYLSRLTRRVSEYTLSRDSVPRQISRFVLGMLAPCELFYWNIVLDATFLTLTWWFWITYAPPAIRPVPAVTTYWQIRNSTFMAEAMSNTSHFPTPIDTVQSALREPFGTFNIYVFLCLTTITLSWFVTYRMSRFFAYYSPVHYSAWVDWWFPPLTITHEVQSENGKAKHNANEFRNLFTMSSFMLEKAYLAKDNLHKFAARRRLAAANMAQAIAKRLGLTIHDGQMSRRSAKRGHNGTRTLMSAKDACSYVDSDLKYQKTKPGSLVTHIDTITHKDSQDANTTLSDGNIHYIYTWNPECVAGMSDEVKFRYDEDGVFITEVEGSAPYRDQLWDFEDDCLVTFSYELAAGFITVISLLTALSIFCYNFYTNRVQNQTLHNVGPFYMEILAFPIPYLVPRTCTFTNHMGCIAGLIHGLSGLPTSWFTSIEGTRYPCVAHRNRYVKYPWVAQAQTMTNEHWFSIFSLLLLALAGSYTPFAMSHKVIRLDVGEHRSIVVVVPNCKFRGYAASLRPFLADAGLRPRTPTVGVNDGGHKFIAEKRKKPSGYSVAFLDSYESRFITEMAYDMTKSLTTDKSSPSISNVRVSCKNEGEENHRIAVALSIALANKRGTDQSYSSNYGFYPLPTIIRQDDDSKADGDPIKEVMAHGAMPPVVSGGANIHARSEAQTRDFVQRRLRDPASKVESTITPEAAMYINEFAANIRRQVNGENGCEHPIEPVSEQYFFDSRTKNQRNKLIDVLPIYDIHNYDPRKGFMKREVLSDPTKAARGICTFPPESQAIGGRLALAYAGTMKACPWMACGLNPTETEEAVIRVCAGHSSVTDTDFSAQDATIDKNKRCIELMLLLQLFEEKWHTVIKDWHYTDYCGRVLYGDSGTKREAHEFNGSRGSGSPFTTLGNTPLTGLFAYTALRLSGKMPDEAWCGLGIYSGDDGVTAELPPASCAQAAEMLGFIEKTSVNTVYVPFLGRHYFDPFSGNVSSIQSPLRTASKLHTTLLNIDEFTAEETMIMKAICLQVTDKDSDFFGPWSKKVLEEAEKKQANCLQNFGAKILKYPGLSPYFAITALKSGTTFRNHPGDFEDLFETEMPGFNWSKFKAWVEDGRGPCPLLWEYPEPRDEAMEAVGPVTLAMGGVHDHANMVEYRAAFKDANGKTVSIPFLQPEEFFDAESRLPDAVQQEQKKETRKKKHARTPSEQKEFLGLIEEKGLLEEYRAAKIVPTDSLDVQKEKRRMRDQITQKVKPVHKPRSH